MDTRSQLKRLTSDTFFYGIGNTLSKFVQFLLFPIYTRVLTQEAFGTQDLISTAFTISFILMIFGLDNGATRVYYDAETDDQRQKIVSTWFWFGLGFSTPVCFLAFIFSEAICRFIFGIGDLSGLFRIAISTVPVAVLAKVVLMDLRLRFKTKIFGLVTTFYVLCQALATICFVVFLGWGVAGILYANLIANGFELGLGLIFALKSIRFSFSLTALKEMLAFGVPTIPAGLAIWVLGSSNRFFLTRLAPLAEIGQLGVATRISTLATFGISAFLSAWPMFAMSIHKDEALARKTYSRTLTYYLVISVGITLLLSAFGRELILILATPDYLPTIVLIPILCLGSVAWGASDVVGIGYTIKKKSYHITIATLLGALANTILNFILIPPFGIRGAAGAVLAGNLVIVLYNFFAGQHYFKVPYAASQILFVAISGILLIGVCMGLDAVNLNWSPLLFLSKAIFSLAFIFVLIAAKVISFQNILSLKASLFARLPVKFK